MKLMWWLLATGAVLVMATIALEVLPGQVATEAVQVFLKKKQPISLEDADPKLDSIYSFFEPSLQPFLRQVPVVFSESAKTSYSFYIRDDFTFVAVSPDFFSTARQSKYWTDFSSREP